MVGLNDLQKALEASWDADTAYRGEWSASNPALNQCFVTAMVVRDYFGGDILNAITEYGSHYWNRLPNGVHIDFTHTQFPTDAMPDLRSFTVRDIDMSTLTANTVERYERLKARVNEKLGAAKSISSEN